MNLYINGYNVILIVLLSFLTSLALVPLVRKISFHVNAIDIPDKRKVHLQPIPSMGGLAFFFSFLLGYMLFAPKTDQMLAILIGSFLIIIVGIIDDISPLRPLWKLLGQIVASLIVVIYGGITFSDMTMFGFSLKFGIFAIPLTVLFIVAIINAINLSDGLDGLAAGSSAIFFLSISIIAYIMNKLGGLDVILCLIMLGATLGFLVFNFNPASIFMGDTGSMFLGFIISIVALLGFKTATITSLIIPILILFVPILDTLAAIIRRSLKGQSFSQADREHLHHQILDSTKSTKKTVLIMYLIDAAFASVSILYALGDNKIAMIIYLLLFILFVVLVFKTDIIIEHKKEDKNVKGKN